ncbi:MAG: acyltransferase [Bryobacterales bacterium]|nr:acyltransferase [Bryobacterales bacterium]
MVPEPPAVARSVFEREAWDMAGSATQLNSCVHGLRGIALSLVFLVHWAQQVQWTAPRGSAQRAIADFLNDAGGAGTDLFLVLAGVYTCRSLARRDVKWTAYTWRRIERLYPLYAVVLVLQLVLLSAWPGLTHETRDWAKPGPLILNLLLAAPLAGQSPVVRQSWTLTYILLFGAVMAWIYDEFELRRHRDVWVDIALVGIGTLALAGATRVLDPWRWAMLPAGAAAWSLRDKIRNVARNRFAAGSVVLAPVIAVFYALSKRHGALIPDGLHGMVLTWLLSLAFSVCMLAPLLSRHNPRWYNSLLRSKPLQLLGSLSFSFYLLHPFAAKAFAAGLSRARMSWVGLLVLTVLAYAAAAGLALLANRVVEWTRVIGAPHEAVERAAERAAA